MHTISVQRSAGREPNLPDPVMRAERTADLVARSISRAILAGEFPPGSRLTEESLAASYQVSRTPVREALIQLASTGLLDLAPNRGATVLQLTLEDVAEVYELRALLEAEASRLAARQATDELASLLEKSCDRLALLHEAAPAEQLSADTEFHYRIAEASGNSRLAALVRLVSAIPEAYRSTIAYTGEDMQLAEHQHRAIAAALRSRRPATAAKLTSQHVHWAGELAVARLESRLGR
jgi:DNA-binding GntR family transcriptional regulator